MVLKDNKTYRNINCIVYEENSPFIFNDSDVSCEGIAYPMIVSPLHDKDVFDSDKYDDNGLLIHKKGDPKKSHYHVTIIANRNGSTFKKYVQEVLHGDLNNIEPTSNLRSSVRYMCHLDCIEDKPVYPRENIRTYRVNKEKLDKFFSNSDTLIGVLSAPAEKEQVKKMCFYNESAHGLNVLNEEHGRNLSEAIISYELPLYKVGHLPPSVYHEYKGMINDCYDQRNLMTPPYRPAPIVVYVTGERDSGKTTFCKRCIEELYQLKQDEFTKVTGVASSGLNLFDQYNEQPVLLMNDFRGNKVSYTDLLTVTDSSLRMALPARYKNKCPAFLDYIFINSKVEFEKLYNTKDDDDDKLGQLKRRISYFVECRKDSEGNRTVSVTRNDVFDGLPNDSFKESTIIESFESFRESFVSVNDSECEQINLMFGEE